MTHNFLFPSFSIFNVSILFIIISGYFAGQYCFLNVPAVNQFEWHPFTISSSPYQALSREGRSGKVTFRFENLTCLCSAESCVCISHSYEVLGNNNRNHSYLFFFCSIKALEPGSWTYRLGEFADEINEYVSKS